MANKKRTQNRRNKRSGKKQTRRTAAKKQRGGVIPYKFTLRIIDANNSTSQEYEYKTEEQLEAAAKQYNNARLYENDGKKMYTVYNTEYNY
jgi:hypothetical protein